MMDARSTLSRMPTLRARRPRRLTSLALAPAAALLVALVGCSGTPEIPDADPAPSAPPLFATEEEALEAATAVYEEYLAVTGQILEQGGQDPSRAEQVVAPSILESELDGAATYASNGWRATDSPVLRSQELQQVSRSPAGSTEVAMYACVDYSSVDVVDSTGASVVSDDRLSLQSFEVAVQFDGDAALVTRNLPWTGGGTCE